MSAVVWIIASSMMIGDIGTLESGPDAVYATKELCEHMVKSQIRLPNTKFSCKEIPIKSEKP